MIHINVVKSRPSFAEDNLMPASPHSINSSALTIPLCLGRETQTCLLQWASLRARGESIRAFCLRAFCLEGCRKRLTLSSRPRSLIGSRPF
jgi:hypothetical protein